MKKGRRWLYLVLAAGLLALGAGGGTFASFNAQTTNKTNSFSTGTLILTDSACSSVAGANNQNNTCTGIVQVQATGDESTSVIWKKVTLTDAGTITAGKFFLAGTGSCTNSRLTTLGTVGTLNKTGKLCTSLDLFIEEVATSTPTSSYTNCWYGGSGATCAATAHLASSLTEGHTYGTKATTTKGTVTVATLTGTITAGDTIVVTTGSNTQKFRVKSSSGDKITLTTHVKATADFGTTSYVVDVTDLGTTVEKFETTIKLKATTTTAIRLLPLSADGTPKTATDQPDLKAKAKRTFIVGLYLPTAPNTVQALEAKFAIKWHITQ